MTETSNTLIPEETPEAIMETPAEPVSNPTPIPKDTSSLTPEELAIYKRISGQSDDWRTIPEKDISDYSLRHDPFMLPEPIKQLELTRTFKFRWISRSIGRLDEVRSAPVPHRWWIVNMDTFPQLPPELFDPVLGCIMRHDQMLVFKPYWMFEKRQALIADITDAQDRSSVERMGSEMRDGVNISGGKKSAGQMHNLPGEIKAGDQVFENPKDPDNKLNVGDFSDLIDT